MQEHEKAEVLAYLEKYSGVFSEMAQEVAKKVLSTHVSSELNPFLNGEKLVEAARCSRVKLDAKAFLAQQWQFWEKQQRLWQTATKAMLGEKFEALIEADQSDKRFADGDWQGNPAFNYVKQAYLLNAEYLNQLVDVFEFEDARMGEQVRFFTRQLVNSMSPSNYVFTNPEVCREILATEGQCLAKGIDNFIRDLEQSPVEAFKVTQVSIDAFKLGEDLAYSSGVVVYRNHLIELIQYRASTPEVFAEPLLIVPPFINKYYILDLDEKKSLVKFLVDQGISVFMISWVNADESHREVDFEHYVQDGIIAAMDVVQDITGAEQLHAAGYCVGGTLLGVTEAYLQSKGDPRIASLTFLTTLFDFSEPGEVGNFLNAQLLPMLEQNVSTKGYMDGRLLALGFSLLRENNLFWSFFIDNYLKGKDPVPFDILYWNSDSTNLPAPAYLSYLKSMYIENRLIEPGGIEIFGQPIDLSNIQAPSYCLAAIADHIVLWQSAYRSARRLGGEKRFVLTESGHVAGVVNPAAKNKYGYWVSSDLPMQPEAWFRKAEKQTQSWWNDWMRWLSLRLGARVAPPSLGSATHEILCEAPGQYVKRRLEAKNTSTSVAVVERGLA